MSLRLNFDITRTIMIKLIKINSHLNDIILLHLNLLSNDFSICILLIIICLRCFQYLFIDKHRPLLHCPGHLITAHLSLNPKYRFIGYVFLWGGLLKLSLVDSTPVHSPSLYPITSADWHA